MNARERVHFLLGVNEILRDSLDFGATLPRLAAHLVPALGDWCVIDVLEERRLERVAAAHADPDKRTLVSRLLGSYPFEAGFQVHLVKPVDPEDLGRILARLDEPVAPAAPGDPGPRVDRAGGFA